MKNRQHFHHRTAYYQSREQEPLVCYSNTYRLRCPSVQATDRSMPASEMPGDLKMISLVWFIVNCDICQQETGICKLSREKRLTCRISVPWHSIPTALAPFSVVIRRMMMQNVDCFSFKWNIQQTICEIKNAANTFLQAPRAFFVFEHFPICTWSFAEYLNNYQGNRRLYTCDAMYTFS